MQLRVALSPSIVVSGITTIMNIISAKYIIIRYIWVQQSSLMSEFGDSMGQYRGLCDPDIPSWARSLTVSHLPREASQGSGSPALVYERLSSGEG